MTAGPAPAAALRALVVDDEAPARRKLLRLLGAMPEVEVVGEAESGAEAVERIAALAPDLVLLDVQMPALDGFGVMRAVGVDRVESVVFVTAYDEHALRAFEVRALDYLLKPVSPARLRDAVERALARRRLARPGAPAPLPTEPPSAGPASAEPPLRHLLVHDARGAQLLPVELVDLARAERNYVVLRGARGSFRVRGTIGELARRLDPSHFLRANRSDVVRLAAIREMQPWAHGDYRIVLHDGTGLLWSRRYRAGQAASHSLYGT